MGILHKWKNSWGKNGDVNTVWNHLLRRIAPSKQKHDPRPRKAFLKRKDPEKVKIVSGSHLAKVQVAYWLFQSWILKNKLFPSISSPTSALAPLITWNSADSQEILRELGLRQSAFLSEVLHSPGGLQAPIQTFNGSIEDSELSRSNIPKQGIEEDWRVLNCW